MYEYKNENPEDFIITEDIEYFDKPYSKEEMDGKNASDHINNRWIEGATVESLIA